MHLHQVEDGIEVESHYTIEGTPYVLRTATTEVLRYFEFEDGHRHSLVCRAETAELESRWNTSPRNAETAKQISEWLQGCWAKYVDLALIRGDVP